MSYKQGRTPTERTGPPERIPARCQHPCLCLLPPLASHTPQARSGRVRQSLGFMGPAQPFFPATLVVGRGNMMNFLPGKHFHRKHLSTVSGCSRGVWGQPSGSLLLLSAARREAVLFLGHFHTRSASVPSSLPQPCFRTSSPRYFC